MFTFHPSQQNKALYTYLQSLETLPTYIYIYLYLYRNNKVTKMPYVALRSHVVETRLEWRTQPIYLSNEHSVALQFWMIVQVGVFKCQGQDCLH